MGWNEDFANGRRSPGSWSNQPGAEAFNAGAREGQRAYDESVRRAYPTLVQPPSPAPTPTFPALSSSGSSQATYGSGSSTVKYDRPSDGASTPMVEMAKAGGVLGVVLFGLFAMTQLAQWTWVQLAVGAFASSAVGAAGGVVLLIAFRILVFVLKVTLALAAGGVILHLLGVIDFPQVVSYLVRAGL